MGSSYDGAESVGEPRQHSRLDLKRPKQSHWERWWTEYVPDKGNLQGGQGRAPTEQSIRKKDWSTQMVPTNWRTRWTKQERLRYSFRKHGFELNYPKWGG